MTATHEVRLIDWDGNILARFHGAGRGVTGGGLSSILYRKHINTPGAHVVSIFGDDERLALFDDDYILEFWRRDLAAGVDWYKDFETFHRYPQDDKDEEGRELFISRGRGFNDILYGRIILAFAGSAGGTKNDPAETVAKEYVNENCGPGAAAIRQMPGLTIQADAASGATWEGGRAYQSLLDVLRELGDFGPGDYFIIGTGPATFEFQWRDGQWGEDRRRGNAAGNAPIVFSPYLGNVQNLRRGKNRLEEINTCYVLGAGVAATRTIRTRTDPTEADTPFSRREVARDARDEQNANALDDRGDEVLDANRAETIFSMDVIQTQSLRYGQEPVAPGGVVFFDIGDLCSVEFDAGEYIDQKIIDITVSVSPGERLIENVSVITEDIL